MTPVTGAIANREKDQLAILFGSGEGFGTPGIPVDGVVSVLEQIRAALPSQVIGGVRLGLFGRVCSTEADEEE
jgi:hypothetical protein